MAKRVAALGLLAVVATGIALSCRGDLETVPPPPGHGTVFTFIADDSVCGVLSFRPLFTGLVITTVGGNGGASLLSAAAAVKVNLVGLRDFATLLSLSSATEGTYDSVTVALSAPEFSQFDPTHSPPIGFLTSKLSSSTPQITISPPLQVTAGKASGLLLDFDSTHSFGVDDQGRLTGNVTPTFRATPITPSGNQGFGEIDDLVGFVQRVDTFSANQSFIGDLQVQVLQNTGSSITVNLTRSTQLFGVSGLNTLLTGSVVEVDGFVDSNGNFVANVVEVEDHEIVEQNMVALIGPVMSLTRDTNGKVTQFNLDVLETEPDVHFDVGDDSAVIVDVPSTTAFRFSSRPTNFAGLAFDPTALTVGQEVVVHGKYTRPTVSSQLTTVAADMVYLKLQSIQGQFLSLFQASADDKTGAFQFTSCFPLLSSTPILVLTSSQTVFVGVAGLNELGRQHSLLVKGLPFFERQATNVNGVAVPAGTIVLLAKQVHQLI